MRRSALVATSVAVLALSVAAGTSTAARKVSACVVTNESSRAIHLAVQPAIDHAAAGDTLVVRGTCQGSFVVTKDLTIRGKSNGGFGRATLAGDGRRTVLSIGAGEVGVAVTASGLTITGGGAGGVAVNLASSLTLVDSTVADNLGVDGAGIAVGTLASLTLQASTVTRNTASGDGGGIYASDNSAPVSVADSSISFNTAVSGGGVAIGRRGNVQLANSVIGGNTATSGLGGGVMNRAEGATPGLSGYVPETFTPGNSPGDCVVVVQGAYDATYFSVCSRAEL